MLDVMHARGGRARRSRPRRHRKVTSQLHFVIICICVTLYNLATIKLCLATQRFLQISPGCGTKVKSHISLNARGGQQNIYRSTPPPKISVDLADSSSCNLWSIEPTLKPGGDQELAIHKLTNKSRLPGRKHLLLEGTTGTGKSFTICSLAANLEHSVLWLVPNKQLVRQVVEQVSRYLPNVTTVAWMSKYDLYVPRRVRIGDAHVPGWTKGVCTINDEAVKDLQKCLDAIGKGQWSLLLPPRHCIFPWTVLEMPHRRSSISKGHARRFKLL